MFLKNMFAKIFKRMFSIKTLLPHNTNLQLTIKSIDFKRVVNMCWVFQEIAYVNRMETKYRYKQPL